MKPFSPEIYNLPKKMIIGIIRLYQKTFSPDHGLFAAITMIGCRYYPSCSEYTIRAIQRDGVLQGIMRGIWRILRCNPFSRGGVDDIN